MKGNSLKMKKVIEYNNKKYLIKCSYSGFGQIYDYKIYEIIETKSVLNKRRFLTSGTTSGWEKTIDIQKKFLNIIISTLKGKEAALTIHYNINEFFKK